MLLAKKCQFFLYLDVIKIRLEILLNYFEDRKETPLTIENRIFQSPKHRIFFKRVIHSFGQDMPFFSLFRFRQNKTRNNAQCSIMLSNGLIQALDQKLPNSSLFRFGHKTRYNA